MKPKIAVLVVAYNAQDTLKAVLDRISERSEEHTSELQSH